MDIRTLRTCIERLAEFSKEGNLKSIRFTWHGGEPMLMSNHFYEQAMDLQEKLLLSVGVDVENIMQSNLLPLTSHKAQLYKNFLRDSNNTQTSIGTSYDPIPNIRRLKNGNYEKKFKESVTIAREYGLRFGFVYTVHKGSIGRAKEIYHFFKAEYPGTQVRFNPIYPEGRAKLPLAHQHHITPGQWGQFLVELYEIWKANGARDPYDPIAEWHQFHHNESNAMSCEQSGNCSNNHLGLDTDGTIYSCGRGIDRGTRPYGSVLNNAISEILNSDNRIKLHNRVVYMKMSSCRECKWWRYCHGGCPIDADISYGNLFHRTAWCKGRVHFFDTVFGRPKDN